MPGLTARAGAPRTGVMEKVKEVPWVERRWSFEEPVGLYPMQVDRLRGVPARLEERVRGLPPEVTTGRSGGSWSIQEHIGHMLDLEGLWSGRVEELLAGAEVLSAADMTNRKTEEAQHDDTPLADLLAAFRSAREARVARLDGLAPEDFARSAIHPRLDRPMRLVDLCRFQADHDDHHLVRILQIARRGGEE